MSAASLQSFFAWYATQQADGQEPWLIFGKGPTFAKRHEYDTSRFRTMSLNHSVREQRVTVAHMIDLDVADACGELLVTNAEYVVMPWYPHVNNKAGSISLDVLAQTHSTLRRLAERGRLLWYNASTGKSAAVNSPIVPVRFFSAEAAINILAMAGVRTIRSLGIDGGASYASDFDDLKDKTLLANQRLTFNRQFAEIAKTIMKTGIDFAPLDIESPVRVYIAATEVQMLAVKVLEYSIRKHASMSVEIYPLHLSGIEVPTPKDTQNLPRTPFTYQRFLIPALCEHQGRAIYMDSDMQVFKDIRQLWSLPFEGADLLAVRASEASGRKPQFSVMLMDCARLPWNIGNIIEDLDAGRLTYEQLMYEMKIVRAINPAIDPVWNSLEYYKEGRTALLHYTDMNTQPWISVRNPLGYLWFRDLFDAIEQGFISIDSVREHVEKGYIRPSVMYQIEHRLEDSFLLPKAARLLDKDFHAPYLGISSHTGSPWRNPLAKARALAQYIYQATPLYRAVRALKERYLNR